MAVTIGPAAEVAFDFRTAPAILFGKGTREKVGALARGLGARALLVTGGTSLAASGELGRREAQLREHGVAVVPYGVSREPDVATVEEGVRVCLEGGCDLVVAIGGGSVLDAAKAIGAIASNGGSPLDYLEGLPGRAASPLLRGSLPMIAVPTTAGSGSEVTKNAVLRVPDAGLKRSLRSDSMVPRVAIVDPELSQRAPLSVTAPAALDAFTHLLEGYVSTGAQPMTDLLALEGVRRSFAALASIAGGSALSTIGDDLALASLWGGMVLANAGLGAVHGLVAPLGGAFPVPHGCGCGALLAATIRANVAALRSRGSSGDALARYESLARAMGVATIEEAADRIDALRRALGIRPLSDYGVTADALAGVVAGARSGSMRSNPIVLTDRELESILTASLSA